MILPKTQIVIEHAFEVLKNKRQSLRYIYAHVKKDVRIISCCCTLLNFLISKGVKECFFYRILQGVDQEDLNGIADDCFSLQSGLPENRNNMADEALILKFETPVCICLQCTHILMM